MERRLSVSIAVIGVAAAAIWIGVAGKRTPQATQIDSALADLEMTVRETAAGTHARAVTLSQLPRLSWAVATDEATVRDLTTEELAFRPQPGESIEIAQVQRAGGGIRRLITIPTDGRPALVVAEPGLHLVSEGNQVRVTAVMQIEARERADLVSGLVGVGQQVDLSRVSRHFEALGITAQLQTSRGSAAISTARSKGRTGTMEVVLRSPAADGAKLILQVPQGIAWGHVTGAILLLLASLVSAKVFARRAGGDRAATQLASSAVTVQPTDMWSDEADDPTLVGPEAGSLASSDSGTLVASAQDLYASRPGTGSRPRPLDLSGPVFPGGSVSTTIPSSLFIAGGFSTKRPPVLPGPDSPWTDEYRRLFSEFVKLRRTCSESTDDLDRDRFIEALHQKRLELMEQHDGAVDVKFRLAFDNGKAAVRFKVQDVPPPPAPAREGQGN